MKILKEKAKALTFAMVALLLISMLAALPPTTVLAQEIPRNEVVVMSSDWGAPPGWNPTQSDTSYMTGIMYPTLFLYSNYEDEWIPYLAKSYRWKDKITLVVTLRDEAKWWDGTPITAYDVKFSLELGKTYNVAMYTPLWTYIEKVMAPDPKTVAFYVNQTTLNYFQVLSAISGPWIVPKLRWQDLVAYYGANLPTAFTDSDPAQIVGGGPYKLKSVSVEAFYYERVEDWWGIPIFGKPTVKYICHRDFKDNAAAAIAFKAGDIDIMTHFTPEIYKLWEVEGLPVRTYYGHPPYYRGWNVVLLYINFLKTPLDDPTLRRAIAYAIPIADMVAGPYYNYGTIAIPVPIIHTSAAVAYVNQSLIDQYGWTYDIAKANKILDDAGIIDTDGDTYRDMPDGTDLKGYTIQVPYGWSDWQAMCIMIQDNLKSIGIGCTAEFPDFSVWWARLTDHVMDFVIGWSGAVPGFDHPWNAFRSTIDPRLSFPAGNWVNYDGGAHAAEIASIIDFIPKESDLVKLKSMYSRLQEIWLQDVVSQPLFYGATWYEYSYKYWVGWPNEENGNWFSNFWNWPWQMPVFFTLVPQPDPNNPTWPDLTIPHQPAWVTNLKFSTDKIFADLSDPSVPLRSADLNGDMKINIMDIAIAAKAFGSYPGHPRWDYRADVNLDNKVDIKDISYVAKRFGTPA